MAFLVDPDLFSVATHNLSFQAKTGALLILAMNAPYRKKADNIQPKAAEVGIRASLGDRLLKRNCRSHHFTRLSEKRRVGFL